MHVLSCMGMMRGHTWFEGHGEGTRSLRGTGKAGNGSQSVDTLTQEVAVGRRKVGVNKVGFL